tara:strand:- start:62 stop:253 length:192 start_codon:yes stop_codon:yes gene_type:complete
METKHQTTGETLAALLKSLKLSKTFKAQAGQLAEQFKLSNTSEIPVLLPQLNELLDKCLRPRR